MNNKTLVLALVIAVGTIVFVQQNATNQTGGNQSNSSTPTYVNPAQAKPDTHDSDEHLVFVQANATKNMTSMYNKTA